MRTNTTKAKLAEGNVVFGAIISRYAPDLVELFGAIGYDFVMIDCEHGPMDLDQVEHMVRAAEVFNITPIARVPNHDDSTLLRFLDRGVQGVIVPHVNTKEEADAIRHIRGNSHQILIRAGFSEVLVAKTFRDIKTKGAFSMERRAEVKEIAFSIFDSKRRTKRGVCFIGPVGTGKTQWATLMAKRYVRKGWESVAMCRLPRFLDRARDQYNRHFDDRESIEEMLKYYLNEQFLVFDDMGVRRGEATSFEQNILYRLIEERHFIAHKTYTVITTNRTLEEMDRDIDERVRSRIMEMCHVVHLDGPDWRAET